MKRLVALIAAAGLASVAAGRPAPGLSIEFAFDPDQVGWFSDVNVMPGDVVLVRVIMSIPDSYYGVAGSRYNIVSNNVDGWDVAGNDSVDLSAAKGSATDGRRAGFDFGTQTQQVFESAGSLRIDANNDINNSANLGISTAQNSPGTLGTLFHTEKVVEVYRFAVHTSAAHAYSDQLILRIADGGLNGSPTQITSFRVYETASSSQPIQIPGAVGDTSVIRFVPAPAALAVFGAAGLGAGRRKR